MSALSIDAAAERTPRATALTDRERTLSFAELAEQVERQAAALAVRGELGPDPVALVPRATFESVAALLALFAHGVPALLVPARWPPAEQQALAARAGARALLDVDREPLPKTHEPAPRPPRALDPELDAVIVATSGSTGRRKLVRLSRRALESAARASAGNLPLHAGDRWLLCLPPSHVGGLSIVTRSLFAGSSVALFDPGPSGLLASLPELGARLAAEPITLMSFVPAVLDALLALSPRVSAPETLRAILLGGAATSLRLYRAARERGLPVLTTYGLTEAASQVATTPLGREPAIDGALVSAGRALPGVELRIRDDGCIALRSPSLGRYVDAPAPLDADGFFVTEDRGRLDPHGELFVLGRASDVIVTGGENVDPGVVEAALENAPGVRAAVVFGVPDERFGEIVACALVTEPDFSWRRAEAAAFARLAPHERPRRAARVPQIPLLLSGKVDRSAARAACVHTLGAWGAG